jgi:hypothetical protein
MIAQMARFPGIKVIVKGGRYEVITGDGKRRQGRAASAQDALREALAEEGDGTAYGQCGSCGMWAAVGECECGGRVA